MTFSLERTVRIWLLSFIMYINAQVDFRFIVLLMVNALHFDDMLTVCTTKCMIKILKCPFMAKWY